MTGHPWKQYYTILLIQYCSVVPNRRYWYCIVECEHSAEDGCPPSCGNQNQSVDTTLLIMMCWDCDNASKCKSSLRSCDRTFGQIEGFRRHLRSIFGSDFGRNACYVCYRQEMQRVGWRWWIGCAVRCALAMTTEDYWWLLMYRLWVLCMLQDFKRHFNRLVRVRLSPTLQCAVCSSLFHHFRRMFL
jgi:hypothetical protein